MPRKKQMSTEILKLTLEVLENNRQAHHYCEDTWYSCPKHEDGCANDAEGDECNCGADKANAEIDAAITAIKEFLAQPEPVAWKYDVTYNQDGTVSVELPNGDELRIVLPNQQEPYCWTWDVWVSGGKWRAEYGWKKPTEKVVNLQPLYTAPPQRKPLSDEEIRKANHHMVEGAYAYSFKQGVKWAEYKHGIKE